MTESNFFRKEQLCTCGNDKFFISRNSINNKLIFICSECSNYYKIVSKDVLIDE